MAGTMHNTSEDPNLKMCANSFFSLLFNMLTAFNPKFVLNCYLAAKSILYSPFEVPETIDVKKLIQENGYTVEEHSVTTKDGYILTAHRIPRGRRKDKKGRDASPKRKEVVLMQHGLLACNASWVMNTPDQSLGFILADEGYDVWLGNVRGNTYGLRHTNSSLPTDKFWDFSFDEMAEYDLRAMIDYVLEKTGQDKLTYVGHSQGTTMAFALLSEHPEYNDKIHIFFALGPVTTIGYAPSVIRYLVPFAGCVKFVLDLCGKYDILSNKSHIVKLSKLACKTPVNKIYKVAFNLVGGIDMDQFNMDRAELFASHEPAGTSTKNLVHWAQQIISMKFQKFDYGKAGNQVKYGQSTPPEYETTNVTAPVALFYGLNDWLSNPVDVHLLQDKMQNQENCLESYCVKLPQFAHFDFIFGKNVRELVYDKMLAILKGCYSI